MNECDSSTMPTVTPATLTYSFAHCALGWQTTDGRFIPLVTEESIRAQGQTDPSEVTQ